MNKRKLPEAWWLLFSVFVAAFFVLANVAKITANNTGNNVEDFISLTTRPVIGSLQPFQNNSTLKSQQEDRKETSERSRLTMLLGIFSIRLQAERRDMIRSTYPTHPQVCPLFKYQTTRDEGCRVLYTFVVGGNLTGPWERTNTTDGPLTVDASSFGDYEDVTYLNIKENMNNGKTPSWFAYAATVAQILGIPYIAKADADTLVHVHALLSHIDAHLPTKPERVYFGLGRGACAKHPNSTLCQGLAAHDWATGEFYVLSTDLAQYVASSRVDRTLVQPRLEDVNMARYVHSHPEPIHQHFVSGRGLWEHPLKNSTAFQSRWNAIQTREMVQVYFQSNSSSVAPEEG